VALFGGTVPHKCPFHAQPKNPGPQALWQRPACMQDGREGMVSLQSSRTSSEAFLLCAAW